TRVVQLVDPGAGFQIETPAATAFVRGTMPRVNVAPDGTTRVANVPDDTGGLVQVQGKDAAGTQVTLQPGEETTIRSGLPPTQPGPMTLTAPGLTTGFDWQQQAQQHVVERQIQRQQEIERLQAQLRQQESGLIAAN